MVFRKGAEPGLSFLMLGSLAAVCIYLIDGININRSVGPVCL